MKLFITLILLFSTVSCTSDTQLQNKLDTFVLKNINIVDIDNRKIQSNKSLIISEGKIQKIINSPQPHLSMGIKVIDGNGGYVTPGLIDMHVHMYEKAAFTIALSHGVTHVRIMNGAPAHLAWRDKIAKGELIGSSATVSSPIISAYDDAYLHHIAHTADQAKAAVEEYHSQGYDLIKVYGNLNEESLTALVETGKALNIPVAKHGPHASGDMPVSSLVGLQSFEHIEDIYQGSLNYEFAHNRLPAIAEEIKATKVPVTPTLGIFYQLTKLSADKENFLNTIPKEYTSDIIAFEAKNNQVKRWLTSSKKTIEHNQRTLTFLQQITRAFHEAEITMLVGSDSGVLLSPHGLATHNEMRLMLESGLDTFDVLAAATINPAKALKLDGQVGKIVENYNADFIFSKANPVNDLSVLEIPDAVVKNGYYYSKRSLKKLRDNAIESRSLWDELTTLYQAL
jgi:imidazolonepropionase-like amidohydrolase